MTAQQKAVDMEGKLDLFVYAHRFFVTVVVLLLVLYGAALILSRTDGFRDLVEQRLRERWDWPVVVERAELNPALTLVLEGVGSENDAADGAGFSVAAMRSRWSLWGAIIPGRATVRSVEARGGAATLKRDADGDWQPAFLARVAGELAAFAGIELNGKDGDAASPPSVSIINVQLSDTNLTWLDRNDQAMASLTGLTFKSNETQWSGRNLRHQFLSADRIHDTGATRRDVVRERLYVDGTPIDLSLIRKDGSGAAQTSSEIRQVSSTNFTAPPLNRE